MFKKELPAGHHRHAFVDSHDSQTFEATAEYPERDVFGWEPVGVDARHQGWALNQATPSESEYLALFGASELFA